MAVNLQALIDLAKAELADIGHCAHYVAEIPQTPPRAFPGIPDDLRVGAYTVLWPTPGAPGAEQAQAGAAQVDVEWRFIVTCAAGLPELLYPLIDLVREKFEGWEPTLAGLSVGTCRQDFDPGPPQPGTGFTPPRFYLQMPYVLQLGS